jgi:MinD superfamily P-loop ATPase
MIDINLGPARKGGADGDVEAANLNLRLNATGRESHEFLAGRRASIDPRSCTRCGTCADVCRFDAISADFEVDTLSCEGCGACYFLCPAKAVAFDEVLCGHYHTAETAGGEGLVFAELLPGGENSGKLVSVVRAKAREIGDSRGTDLILVAGPPGIGCPVISSLTGAHLAVLVTEPTKTGVHDLERVAGLARHFGIRTAVVVNKGDINPACMRDIESFCRESRIELLGVIPYEPMVTEAQRRGKTVLEFAPGSPASTGIRGIFDKLRTILEEL